MSSIITALWGLFTICMLLAAPIALVLFVFKDVLRYLDYRTERRAKQEAEQAALRPELLLPPQDHPLQKFADYVQHIRKS